MTVQIVPFADEHLDGAASVLAQRAAADRQRAPMLPARFEARDAAAALIAQQGGHADSAGVVALRGAEVAGFMLGRPALPPPTAMWASFVRPRAASIDYAGFAATGEDAVELYRLMYAALAQQWVDAGLFCNYVEAPADDETALEAWFSLGFGQEIAFAVRDTTPLAPGTRAAEGLEIRRASAADFEDVMRLADGLARYHAGSPMFLPYPRETWPDARAYQERLLAEPNNPHWLAYRDGAAVGMQTFHHPTVAEAQRPDGATYLFQGFTMGGGRGAGVGSALLEHTMAWARESGFDWCTLHFLTANLLGARFWQRHGFRPLCYRLVRQVDERIAWAHGRG
jgi:ribosomal protein S18 acetylase RimI-like enzyme